MLSFGQLYLLQSCRKAGFPEELLPNFLSRCGATGEEHQDLVSRGLIESKGGRLVLTRTGKRTYEGERKRGGF